MALGEVGPPEMHEFGYECFAQPRKALLKADLALLGDDLASLPASVVKELVLTGAKEGS